MVKGEERYIIDRILRKEQRRQPGDKVRRTYYRIRWQGYQPDEDSWIKALELRE
jgi:Chromo (CHRromatin Organisation MOdifier) domain